MKKSDLNAYQIRGFLWEKYHDKNQWVCFEELRNTTGYARAVNYIDFYAMNVYPSKGYLRIAYEIKVSRGDFLAELKQPAKRKFAFDNSHQFYFIAPRGIIETHEVPRDCGLILVNENGRMTTKKIAKDRALTKKVDLNFFAAMARRISKNPGFNKRIFRYAGKNLNREEVLKIISDLEPDHLEWRVRREIDNKVEEEFNQRHPKLVLREERIKHILDGLRFGSAYQTEDQKIVIVQKMLDYLNTKRHFASYIRDLEKDFNKIKETLSLFEDDSAQEKEE